jgi:hypothetical protein
MSGFLEENPKKGETTKEDKVLANEGGLVKAVVGLCPAPLPLFLSETDLQNQGNRYAWRKGVPSTVNNLFRTPRETSEFPSVFQNTPKTATIKALPFTYKAFQRVRPSINIPEPTEEPAYAPVSRPTTPLGGQGEAP